jgi:hypothetical protein
VQDYGLAGPLAKIAATKSVQQFEKAGSRPGEITQILFGVVSLLRHLSIPSEPFLFFSRAEKKLADFVLVDSSE